MRNQKLLTKICHRCRKRFKAARSHVKFCAVKCRVAAFRLSKRIEKHSQPIPLLEAETVAMLKRNRENAKQPDIPLIGPAIDQILTRIKTSAVGTVTPATNTLGKRRKAADLLPTSTDPDASQAIVAKAKPLRKRRKAK